MQRLINEGEGIPATWLHGHDLAGVLKMFLRELPEGLLNPVYHALNQIRALDDNGERTRALQLVFHLLPLESVSSRHAFRVVTWKTGVWKKEVALLCTSVLFFYLILMCTNSICPPLYVLATPVPVLACFLSSIHRSQGNKQNGAHPDSNDPFSLISRP